MKKTIKKRAFVSAIAMLIVSAVVLTSSTFAWFSMSKKVEVEAMKLNITSPDGIQISANAKAFTTKVTREMLLGTAEQDRYNADTTATFNYGLDEKAVISPASSSFNVAAGALPVFFTASIDDAGNVNAVKSNDASGAYVCFDVFIKLATASQVWFNQTTLTCKDNPEVVYAMHMAFVNCGTTADASAAVSIKSGIKARGGDRSICAYQIDSTHHTANSGHETDEIQSVLGLKSAFSNQSPVPSGSSIINNTTYAETVTCTRVNDTTKDTDGYINCGAGITRVRIYLWMEGNDWDCANDVAGSQIEFNPVFTLA